MGVCKSVLSFLIGKALHPDSVFIREGSLDFPAEESAQMAGIKGNHKLRIGGFNINIGFKACIVETFVGNPGGASWEACAG